MSHLAGLKYVLAWPRAPADLCRWLEMLWSEMAGIRSLSLGLAGVTLRARTMGDPE